MNSQRLILAWIASVAAFGLFCALVFYVNNHTRPILQATTLDDTDTVVIGSSLSHAAIPAFEVGGSLFDDGRPHKMLLVGGITEDESLTILDHAISRGVSTVIVEANDHLYSKDPRDWLERTDRLAGRLARQFRRGLRLLEGSQSTEVKFREGEFPELSNTMKVRRKKYKPSFRVLVKEDGGDKLAALVNRAKENGTEVILFVPPFSTYYDEGLKGSAQAIGAQADRLAEILDVDLWRAASPWGNDLFRDVMHLNVHGRDQFVDEIKNWLRVTHDDVATAQSRLHFAFVHPIAPSNRQASDR